jgi:hypothetical protein
VLPNRCAICSLKILNTLAGDSRTKMTKSHASRDCCHVSYTACRTIPMHELRQVPCWTVTRIRCETVGGDPTRYMGERSGA